MTKVKVYSTPTCTICKQLKNFLKEKDIRFQDIDVAGDTKAVQEMIEKSGQMSVPVIEIDGKVIVGYDRKELEKALNL
jgi:glutaredoxin-like YruB-family protein